jgi:hypothetical protein
MISTPAQATERTDPAWQRCQKLAPEMRRHKLPPRYFVPICVRESKGIRMAFGVNYRDGSSHRDCAPKIWNEYLKSCAKHIKSTDYSYFQINSSWRTLTKQICGNYPESGILFDKKCQFAVASYLYNKGGGLANWRGSSS